MRTFRFFAKSFLAVHALASILIGAVWIGGYLEEHLGSLSALSYFLLLFASGVIYIQEGSK